MPRNTINMEETCERIKQLCSAKNITASNLADVLGVSRQAVYSWFNHKKMPSSDHLVEIADVLEMPLDDMVVRRNLD